MQAVVLLIIRRQAERHPGKSVPGCWLLWAPIPETSAGHVASEADYFMFATIKLLIANRALDTMQVDKSKNVILLKKLFEEAL